jgi:hypothetical protein
MVEDVLFIRYSIVDSMIDRLRVETSSSEQEAHHHLFNSFVVLACGRELGADMGLLVRVVLFPMDGMRRDGKWG